MILTLRKPFSRARSRYSSTTRFTSRGWIVCRSKTSVISMSTGSGKGVSRSKSEPSSGRSADSSWVFFPSRLIIQFENLIQLIRRLHRLRRQEKPGSRGRRQEHDNGKNKYLRPAPACCSCNLFYNLVIGVICGQLCFLTLSPARLKLAVFQILAFLLTNTQEEAVSGVAVPAPRKESRRDGCAEKDYCGRGWKCGRYCSSLARRKRARRHCVGRHRRRHSAR